MTKRLPQLSLIVTILFVLPVAAIAAEQHSIEYMLAVLDSGKPLSKPHPSVIRFRSLLKQLDETYIENPQEIADMTVTSQTLLREKYGVEESLLNIMEGMNQVFSAKVQDQKYPEYLSSYITLRDKGMSHLETFYSLRSIADALFRKPSQTETESAWIDPQELSRGQAFFLSKQTPLIPEFEPKDYTEAVIQRIKQIPKGGVFKVYEVRKKGTRAPWYRVAAIDKNKKKIGESIYIN